MRKIVHLLQSVVLLGATTASVHAQPVAFAAERENWLRKAADNMPKLTETVKNRNASSAAKRIRTPSRAGRWSRPTAWKRCTTNRSRR